jgi:sugar lactone lactonase YvrE
MKEHQARLFADDFVFLEAPRWRRDRLWVSDVFDLKLYTLGLDGSRTFVCDMPHRPAGIDFLPDGTPVVVSMRDRKLMKIVNGTPVLHADLSSFATGDVNDLVADLNGRIYVGNFGYDFHGGAPKALADMHLVEPDGSVRVAADGLEFPNGAVLMDEGHTLVVAETWACRLTAFERTHDGTLVRRRLFADLGNRQPDGICVDSQGGIWAACFNTGEVVRVLDGGAITDRVACARHAVACHLGGDDGRTLFCTGYTGTFEDMEAKKRLAAVFAVDVQIPGP